LQPKRIYIYRQAFSVAVQPYHVHLLDGSSLHFRLDNISKGFAESLQHFIKPQISITSLYGSFSALNLPYKEVTEF